MSNTEKTFSPEEMMLNPNIDSSKIRWMFRLNATLQKEFGRTDIINLGIGQAGHEAPPGITEKMRELEGKYNKYPSGVTSKESANIIAQKMILTHFTDEGGKVFAKPGVSAGSLIPDFYVGEGGKVSKDMGSVVGGNGASGFLTTFFQYASNKGYNDFAFVVPYFGPYTGHLNNIKEAKDAAIKQVLGDKATEEEISKYSIKNPVIDLAGSNYRWDKKALAQYERLLDVSDGKLVLTLCSPNNPSGASITKDEYKDLIRSTLKFSKNNMPMFCMDEPYDLMTFKASGKSDFNNVNSPIEAEWRQHISITHALNEMVHDGEITNKQASNILDNTLFVNSASKGPAAAALGGGMAFTVNTSLAQDIQKATFESGGPLRSPAIISIDNGIGYYVENPEKIKEISAEYGTKSLSFKKWMNYECKKREFLNKNQDSISVSYDSDGAMYLKPDISGFIGMEIPDTKDGTMVRNYKKHLNKEPIFENAEDVALYLMFDKGIVMVPGDGFGLDRVSKGQEVGVLRASIGETPLEKLREVAQKYGEAIDSVREFNKGAEVVQDKFRQ